MSRAPAIVRHRDEPGSSTPGCSRRFETPPGDRQPAHILGAAAPALIVFTVYCVTLAPTVTGEDSGELITAAYFFGVPHPPGYPLWTMLCGAWTHLLPIGSIAWRAN